VCVRLPRLPLEYFDYSILKRIGDRIVKTVRVDHTTLESSRGNFARLYVEVDLSKPLLLKYRLRRRVRRIEYEGLDTIYFQCGWYGHEEASCPEKEVTEVIEPAVTSFSNPMFNGDGLGEDRPEVEGDFGPWMMVKRQPRRSNTNRPVVQKSLEKVLPATSNEKGKSSNRFDVLYDIGKSGDLEGVEKVVADSSQRPTDFEGNKENFPHPKENIPQGLMGGGSTAPPFNSVPKKSETVKVIGPDVTTKGLGIKRWA
ncbi:hypothetical protein LINPERHAP2_LOCUS809, partial [Linum perenne]